MAIVIATGVAEQDDDDGGGSEDDEAYDDVKLTRAAMTKVQNMMRELKGHQSAWLFMDPVDPAAVPGYAEAVAQPMDLSTVQVQLNNGAYSLLSQLAADLRLITANCIAFNKGMEGAGTVWREY